MEILALFFVYSGVLIKEQQSSNQHDVKSFHVENCE